MRLLSETESQGLPVEYAVVGIGLVAAAAVHYLLSVSLFVTGLLVCVLFLVGVIAFVPGVWPTLYRTTGVSVGAWLLAAAVAAGGIALSYWIGDPRPFCDSALSRRGCFTTYGWASAVYLASAFGVAIAAGHLDRYRRLRNASVVPAAEVDDGPVAVEGNLVPAGEPVAGPVSDEPTVWYRSAVERATLFEGHREIDHDVGGGEFYVEDGSGRLLVLPERLDDHDVADLARSHTDSDGERRRREWSYEPNDVVTVVGVGRSVSRAAYPEPIVVGLEEPVIVGLGTLSELRNWAATRVLVGAAFALVGGGGSLLVMVLAA